MISPNYFIRTNKNLVITEVNHYVVALLGRSESELLGTHIEEYFSPINLSESSYKVSYLNLQFNLVTASISCGFAFFLVDINEPATNIEEVGYVELALASSEIGVWSYQPSEDKFQCNQTFRRIIGLPIDNNITLSRLLALVYKDDRELFPVFFENHVHFNIPLEFEFRSKDRKVEKWFSLKGRYVNSTEFNHLVGTIEDCTIEKNMVIALNEANESKQLAIEAGKIGTWNGILENDEWLWQWDLLANSIFKMLPEDIGNLNKWVERLHPDDKEQVTATLKHSLETGEEFISYYRSILPDGDIIYVFAQGRVGRNMLGEISRIDGVCIDQTHIYKTQEELKILNTELEKRVDQRTKDLNSALVKAEKASQIKSNFLAMMSHELRTPLNGIIGSLDLLSNAKLNYDNADLVKTASISANNLIAILNDVLDINKIEAGKLELEHTLFDISEVIHQVVVTFAAKAKEKSIQFNVLERNNLEKSVMGDENRLRQILLNLVGNAIKFTGNDNFKKHHIDISVDYEKINEYQIMCTIAVVDSGIGIKNDVIDKLFTPFTQAEKSTTRQYGGTGLGLSICGKLVDLMGGQIKVNSNFGIGSEFKVKIPFWVDNESPIEQLDLPLQIITLGQESDASSHLINLFSMQVQALNSVIIDKSAQLDLIDSSIYSIFIIENASLLDQARTVIDICPKVEIFSLLEQHEAVELIYPHLFIHPIQPVTSFGVRELLTAKDNELDLIDDDLSLVSEECSEDTLTEKHAHDILLVEDNPFNQKLLKRQLQSLGFDCDIADNGEQGLSYWKSRSYKMILTDCHMPKLDGYEMTKLIRSKEAQLGNITTPIIAVTGATMNDDVDYCISIGMNDFLSKPVKLVDIKRVMEKWYV